MSLRSPAYFRLRAASALSVPVHVFGELDPELGGALRVEGLLIAEMVAGITTFDERSDIRRQRPRTDLRGGAVGKHKRQGQGEAAAHVAFGTMIGADGLLRLRSHP